MSKCQFQNDHLTDTFIYHRQNTFCFPFADPDWTPVLLLIPVRLGGERLNPLYIPCLRALLASDSCVGIVGGRPRDASQVKI